MFDLASRQTEGFLRSLLTLLNLDNDVPDHSTISRRKARLGKVEPCDLKIVLARNHCPPIIAGAIKKPQKVTGVAELRRYV